MEKNKKWLRHFDHKIIGFVILFLAAAYFFGVIIFNTKSLLVLTLSIISFISFTYGYFFVFKEQMAYSKMKINFKDIDVLFVALSAFVTYYLATIFSLNVVIASSLVGIIGYGIFRNNSIAIYCGSFAGMSSNLIFNFYEMILVAIICAIIFILIKNMLNGCGGRLGSIAFASTAMVGLLFNKTGFVVESNYNIILLFVFALLSIFVAYVLRKYFNYSAVIASAMPSLIFAIIFEIFFKEFGVYPAIFFTASFIGMVDLRRIPKLFYIPILAISMTIIFFVFFNYFNGYGGKMGMSAFIALIAIIGLMDFVKRIETLVLKKKQNL